jgi:hypothetical protein
MGVEGDHMENLYYLMSLNVVAYLKMKGFKPIKIERTNNNRIKYWFIDSEQLQKTIEEYKQNKELKDFIRLVKETKDEIHDLK